MIEINELYKYYGEHKAIGPLSCSIADGEIVGLLGLNGAGKTTTLRILACDLLPSGGTVLVDGLDVVEQPDEVRARIGYLPDTPPLYQEMTVESYLHFAARLRGLTREEADRRVPQVLADTQLEHVRRKLIATLSHGYKQRVGIAQAIVHAPRLLVLDEPITGLDPAQIVEMRALLNGLRGKHTILLSSHILSEISETCDRILVLTDGSIGASGTEDELTKKLGGGARAEVTVRGDGASITRARAAIAAIEGVSSVDEAASAEEGAVTLAITSTRDVRADVSRAVVNEGLDLMALRAGERELEAIFLALAGRDAKAGDKPEQEGSA